MSETEYTPPEWALRARQVMRAQGITQESLSDVLGVKPASVSHYFTGRREPEIGQIVNLARHLRVNVSQLLGELPLTDDPQEARELDALIQDIPEGELPLILDVLRAIAARSKSRQ